MIENPPLIKKIHSGGQTGVDRAALDTAIALGISHGGWCPLGRLAEDGCISERYQLKETPSAEYAQRTEWNVRDANGTLILNQGELSGGTLWTVEMAKQYRKPYWVVQLEVESATDVVSDWLHQQPIQILNIAGPRESEQPGIYDSTKSFLWDLLKSREEIKIVKPPSDD